ncbi:Uncharacterised protein [Mycobacteroides abscessus subsp. abscessus]|nr:Uncharacterised protein [Mycobacteroides abscessus subsp. abscessus]
MGVRQYTVSLELSAAADAVPKADSAHRWLVICLGSSLEPAPLNITKARSRAWPGSDRYQPGSSTASGSAGP